MNLVEFVKGEVKKIIDEEMQALKSAKEHWEDVEKRATERINKLIESYSDMENMLNRLSTMSMLGISSNLCKVIEINKETVKGMGWFSTEVEKKVTISVGNNSVFYTHPSGEHFLLDTDKNYKLIVAFIPEEKKDSVSKTEYAMVMFKWLEGADKLPVDIKDFIDKLEASEKFTEEEAKKMLVSLCRERKIYEVNPKYYRSL